MGVLDMFPNVSAVPLDVVVSLDHPTSERDTRMFRRFSSWKCPSVTRLTNCMGSLIFAATTRTGGEMCRRSYQVLVRRHSFPFVVLPDSVSSRMQARGPVVASQCRANASRGTSPLEMCPSCHRGAKASPKQDGSPIVWRATDTT